MRRRKNELTKSNRRTSRSGLEELKMVDLLIVEERYEEENYTPKTIFERIKDIQVDANNLYPNGNAEQTTSEEVVKTIHARKMIVLQNKMLEAFIDTLFPEFEDETSKTDKPVARIEFGLPGSNDHPSPPLFSQYGANWIDSSNL